jgi:hypothetical protein
MMHVTLLEVELEVVNPPDIEEWIEPGLGVWGLNFFGSSNGKVTPSTTDFFPVFIVITLAAVFSDQHY